MRSLLAVVTADNILDFQVCFPGPPAARVGPQQARQIPSYSKIGSIQYLPILYYDSGQKHLVQMPRRLRHLNRRANAFVFCLELLSAVIDMPFAAGLSLAAC